MIVLNYSFASSLLLFILNIYIFNNTMLYFDLVGHQIHGLSKHSYRRWHCTLHRLQWLPWWSTVFPTLLPPLEAHYCRSSYASNETARLQMLWLLQLTFIHPLPIWSLFQEVALSDFRNEQRHIAYLPTPAPTDACRQCQDTDIWLQCLPKFLYGTVLLVLCTAATY